MGNGRRIFLVRVVYIITVPGQLGFAQFRRPPTRSHVPGCVCVSVVQKMLLAEPESPKPNTTTVVFRPGRKEGRFTRKGPKHYLGQELEWVTISSRLSMLFQATPTRAAETNLKAKELGWPRIRGPIVIVAAGGEGEEDDVTPADIEQLCAAAKADLARRAAHAQLLADDNGSVEPAVTAAEQLLGGAGADDCVPETCTGGVCRLPADQGHQVHEFKYTGFPAHRNVAKRGYVFEDMVRAHLFGPDDTNVGQERVCDWYYLCANAHTHDPRLSKFKDGYLCERIGPIPLGMACPACGGRNLSR